MLDRTLLHYRILRKLGEGGMGEVYLALDTKLGREVAIKILPPGMACDQDRLERFRREATAIAALNHDNIITIHSVEETEGVHFFAMEFVDGATLSEVIPEKGLEVSDFLELAIPIADAMAAAHQRGVTHRDLKPGNIMVTHSGRVKVLDFGLAKVQADTDSDIDSDSRLETEFHTSDGMVLGTTHFMSPEQLKGHAVDHRSDVYSMGVIFFIMATGRHPHHAGSTAEVISGILAVEAPSVAEMRPRFPESLGRIIQQCLDKDPSRRFSSAFEVARELEAAQSRSTLPGIGAGRPSPESRSRRAAWPVSKWTAFGAVLVLTLIGTAFLISRTNLEPPSDLDSLAVLPLANLTGDADVDFLKDAFSAGLMSRLREVEGLQVAGRAEAWAVRPRQPSHLGAELGVGAVVDGDIQKDGNALRFTISLTDALTGFVLWAHPYRTGADGYIHLQKTVAHDLAVFLSIPLTPHERRRIARSPDAPHLAFDYYVKGQRYLDDSEDPQAPDAAVENFRQALRVDPELAPALVGLSEALWQIHRRDADTDALTRAEKAARRAQEIDPGLAAARVALARVYRASGRQKEAIGELNAALDESPKPEQVHRELARSYERVGELAEAEQSLRAATALRPDDWSQQVALGTFLCKNGSYDEGRLILKRAAELAPPSVTLPTERLATFDLTMGRFEEAIDAYQHIVDVVPNPRVASNLGTAYYYSDRPDRLARAEEYYLRAVRLNPMDAVNHANLGDLYRTIGHHEKAHERYLEARDLVTLRAQEDPDNPFLIFERADYSAKAEDCDTALSLAGELSTVLPDTGPNAHQLAYIYAVCRDDDAAIAALQRAVDHGESVELIRREDEFQHLLNRPDFANLVGG